MLDRHETKNKGIRPAEHSAVTKLISVVMATLMLFSMSPLFSLSALGDVPEQTGLDEGLVAEELAPAVGDVAEIADLDEWGTEVEVEEGNETEEQGEALSDALGEALDPANPIGIEPTATITSGGLLSQLNALNQNGTIQIGNENWVVVRVYGSGDNKALLLARRGSDSYDQLARFGANNNYSGSDLQAFYTGYYNGWTSPLKDLALIPTLGAHNNLAAVSNPLTPFQMASSTSQTVDVVFALSRQDMINWNQGKAYPTQSYIKSNWANQLAQAHFWLRTKGTDNSFVWEYINIGPGYIADSAQSVGSINRVPALWVKVADVWRTVTVHYVNASGVPINPSFTTSYQVPYDGSILLQPSDIPNFSGYQFTSNWRIGSATSNDRPLPVNLANVRQNSDIYLVYDQVTPPGFTITVHYIDESDSSEIEDQKAYTVPSGDPFTLPNTDILSIRGYSYIGWKIGTSGSMSTSLPVTIPSVTQNTDIYLIYEEIEIIPFAEKNAYLSDVLNYPVNGTAANPAPVGLYDTILYSITTMNYKNTGGPTGYDVLFVVDWSASMSGDMGIGGVNGRAYAMYLVQEMADHIMGNYPNSRVASMTMSASLPNTNNPTYTHIVSETEFFDETDYSRSKIVAGWLPNTTPANPYSDNSTYLLAAMDKLAGISAPFGLHTTGGEVYTRGRDLRDVGSRHPVIVLISDFMIWETTHAQYNNSGQNYWADVLKSRSDEFWDAYGEFGIFQTIRIGHLGYISEGFAAGAYVNSNRLMTNYLSPNGHEPYWGFWPVAYSTQLGTSANSLKDRIDIDFYDTGGGGLQGTIIIDHIPDGLEFAGTISDGGSYNAINHNVTWNLSSIVDEEVTVVFAVFVMREGAVFENSALAVWSDGTQIVSNSTYHRSGQLKLTERFRELGNETNILSPLDGNELYFWYNDAYVPAAGTPPDIIIQGGISFAYYGYRVGNGDIDVTPHQFLPIALITALNQTTEITYLYIEQAKKDAYFGESDIPSNGTEDNPEFVFGGETIRYVITVDNQVDIGQSPAKYDVLFVLDWSDSMNGTMQGGQPARYYARDAMIDMFDFILSNYLNSRVAVMAMNCKTGLSNNELNTNIQFETDFMTPYDFYMGGGKDAIESAFDVPPAFSTEDLATFLKAACYKIEGTSHNFGNDVDIPVKTTIPRKPIPGESLSERTPMIVFISDFQIPRTQSVNGANYWSKVFPVQVDRFDTWSKGILQTVRFDHGGNKQGGNAEYSSLEFDGFMISNISPAGRGHWGFTKVDQNTSSQEALQIIKDGFMALAPPGPNRGMIVSDFVPEGMIVDVNPGKISNGGYYDPVTHTVNWNLNTPGDNGRQYLTFYVTVPFDFTYTFINNAALVDIDGRQSQTNNTYHTSRLNVVITDRFRELNNEDNIIDPIHDGIIHELPLGGSYEHDEGIPFATLEKDGITYVYYGYRIDDGPINMTFHSDLPDLLIPNVMQDKTITFLYAQQPTKNAYINGGSIAENGSEDNFVRVEAGDTITYVITFKNQYTNDEFASFTLMDTLPDGLVFAGGYTTTGDGIRPDAEFTPAGQNMIWEWFGGLNYGTYTVSVLVEVAVNTDIELVNFATFLPPLYRIDTNSTYHNVKTVGEIDFFKVDEKDDPLAFVAFELFKCSDANPSAHEHDWVASNDAGNCWEDLESVVSGFNGNVHFFGVSPGTYMLVEIGTVENYQLPQGQWMVVMNDQFEYTFTAHGPKQNDTMTLPPAFKPGPDGVMLLPNYLKTVLPMAGGPGIVHGTVAGIILAGGGILFAIMPQRLGVVRRRVAYAGAKRASEIGKD